jgi:hypothetical protein
MWCSSSQTRTRNGEQYQPITLFNSARNYEGNHSHRVEVTIVDVQLLIVIELDGRNRDEGIVDLSSIIARLLGDRVW